MLLDEWEGPNPFRPRLNTHELGGSRLLFQIYQTSKRLRTKLTLLGQNTNVCSISMVVFTYIHYPHTSCTKCPIADFSYFDPNISRCRFLCTFADAWYWQMAPLFPRKSNRTWTSSQIFQLTFLTGLKVGMQFPQQLLSFRCDLKLFQFNLITQQNYKSFTNSHDHMWGEKQYAELGLSI